MESAKTEVVPILHSPDFRVKYVINSRISAVEEEFQPTYISGFGADAIFENRSRGWFVYLEGSYEALHLGKEKPELQKGDRIKITLERWTDANFEQSPI